MGGSKKPIAVALSISALLCALAIYESGPWFSLHVTLGWIPAVVVYVLLLVGASWVYEPRRRRWTICAIWAAAAFTFSVSLLCGSERYFMWRLAASREYFIAEAKRHRRGGPDNHLRLVGFLVTHGSYFENGRVVFHTHDGLFIPYGIAVDLEGEKGQHSATGPSRRVNWPYVEPPLYAVSYLPPDRHRGD